MLAGVVEGTLEPSLRSEEAPANDLDGGIRVVVGKTFDRLVKHPGKDVFLEVRNQGTGACALSAMGGGQDQLGCRTWRLSSREPQMGTSVVGGVRQEEPSLTAEACRSPGQALLSTACGRSECAEAHGKFWCHACIHIWMQLGCHLHTAVDQALGSDACTYHAHAQGSHVWNVLTLQHRVVMLVEPVKGRSD